jgi:hypothetical protein
MVNNSLIQPLAFRSSSPAFFISKLPWRARCICGSLQSPALTEGRRFRSYFNASTRDALFTLF